MLVAKDSGGIRIPPLEDGVYQAVCSDLVDIGTHRNEMYGQERRQVVVMWSVVGENVEINGQMEPRVLSKKYTLSLAEKSNLKKDLNAWRTRAFTEEELQGFDLRKIVGTGCQLSVKTVERNGKRYPKIDGVMGLPRGVKLALDVNPIVFDLDEPDVNVFEKLPAWIKKEITGSSTYAECGYTFGNESNPYEDAEFGETYIEDDDELPF